MHEGADSETTIEKHQRWLRPVLVGVILLLCVVVGVLGWKLYTASQVSIPASIASKLSFPAYLPNKMPGNYRLNKDSIALQEDNTVLVFTAVDNTGSTITFTEQQKPKNFDFNAFYDNQLKDPKTLSGLPYSSVWGIANDGQSHMLSVATDSTWILVTTRAPLGEGDLKILAQDLKAIR